MRNRVEEIKAKGFDMIRGQEEPTPQQTGYSQAPVLDFSKIKIGAQTLEDAVLDIGELKRINPRLANKKDVLKAIDNYDLVAMREISEFFYKTSGIYSRILRYMAFMYRYDYFVTPYVPDEKYKNDKIVEEFRSCLNTLDNFKPKKVLGEIALKVLRQGCYYGYKVEQNGKLVLQELPCNFCRSRFFQGDKPAVEFNMKFFDTCFKSTEQKMRVLKMFPKEIQKGYALYKQGKLPADAPGDDGGWYLLDPDMTVKFTANGEDYPMFISVVPLILDLDAAQDLDRKKTMQRLLKLVIQKLPLDKNGELIFDIDEGRQLHNNAVGMLKRAIGVDVLTTFADVSVEDLSDSNASTSQSDDLERVERQIYNEAGVSQKQFNTDSNIALEKSILNDAATMNNMVLQFQDFLNELIEKHNKKPKKIYFKVDILPTTIYNFMDLSKMYKEQMQLGFSKMLPQVALGQPQSAVLATAYFENDVLDLVEVFVPPLQSSVMNGDTATTLKTNQKKKSGSNAGDGNVAAAAPTSDNTGGRPEKADDQKSEKTIANREAMN